MSTTDVMRLPSAGREGSGERFNYKGMHRYIITQPVHAGRPLFSAPEPVFAALNILRESAAKHRFDIYAYCFMPTRLLLIVRGRDDESDMKAFLSAFRSSSALDPLLGTRLWTRKYTERVLRKTEETRIVARELLMTPVKEGLASSPRAYPFLGSFAVNTAVILSIPGWEKKARPPFKKGGASGSGRRSGGSGGHSAGPTGWRPGPGGPPFGRGEPGTRGRKS